MKQMVLADILQLCPQQESAMLMLNVFSSCWMKCYIPVFCDCVLIGTPVNIAKSCQIKIKKAGHKKRLINFFDDKKWLLREKAKASKKYGGANTQRWRLLVREREMGRKRGNLNKETGSGFSLGNLPTGLGLADAAAEQRAENPRFMKGRHFSRMETTTF